MSRVEGGVSRNGKGNKKDTTNRRNQGKDQGEVLEEN